MVKLRKTKPMPEAGRGLMRLGWLLLVTIVSVGAVACAAVATPLPATATPIPASTPDIAGTVEAIVNQRLFEVATVTPAPTPTLVATPTLVPTSTPIATATPNPTPRPTPTSTPRPTSTPTFAQVTAKVRNAVVRIETPVAMGSGTIINSGGDILTNYHVIKGYNIVNVRINDAAPVTGIVVGFDELKDIALINVQFRPLTFIPLSSRRPDIGEEIITIGYPLDLRGSSTTTRGVVSAIRRIAGQTFIQTDAAINPGNSGGAAIDRYGRFIGIPTSMLDEAANIGFLLPGFNVAGFIQQLRGGYRYALPTPTPFPTATPWPTATPPPSASDHFLQADFYYDTCQYYLAISEYSLAISQSPYLYQSYFNNRGNAYYLLGLYSQAVDDYTQAVQISGGTSGIHYNNRANAWYHLGMYEQMNADIAEACRLDPQYC